MILARDTGGGVVLGVVLTAGLLEDDGGAVEVGVGSVAAPLEQAATANNRQVVVRIPLDLCTR
ncbi:hypothetical protein ACWEOG_11525 [Amycolatopsis japonica]